MNHDQLREKLSVYLDGEVSPDERLAIEAHLKTCAACRDALEALDKTVQRVKTLEEMEPPAWMTQKIMAQVRSKAESRTSIWQKLFFPLHIKLPIKAVTALFCVVLGYYVYHSVQPAVKLAEAPVQTEQRAVVRNEAAPEPASAAPPVAEPDTEQQSGMADVRQAVKDEAKLQAPVARTEEQQPAGKTAAARRERKSVPVPSVVPTEAPSERLPAETGGTQAASDQAQAARDIAARSEESTRAAAKTPAALAVAEAPGSALTLLVADLEQATAEINQKIRQSGGTVVRSETSKNEVIISATVPPARLGELLDYLSKLGSIRDQNLLPARSEAPAPIKITVTPDPRKPSTLR